MPPYSARDAEVQADRLGVADVQVAVRLGRKPRGDAAAVLAGRVVGVDDLADEVEALGGPGRRRGHSDILRRKGAPTQEERPRGTRPAGTEARRFTRGLPSRYHRRAELMMPLRTRVQLNVFVAAIALAFVTVVPSHLLGQRGGPPPAGQQTPPQGGRGQGGQPNFEAALQRQVQTDATWRKASEGFMKMEKTTYKSRKDGMEIPVFVFTPLKLRGDKAHPAIVWVHPDIRGHLYEYYIPVRPRSGLSRLRRRRAGIPRQRRLRPGVLRRHRLRRRRGGRRRHGGRLHQVDDAVRRSGPDRDHRLEPRRHDHAAVDHARADSVQGGGRDGAGDQSLSAAVLQGVERQHQQIDPANRIGGLPGDSAA